MTQPHLSLFPANAANGDTTDEELAPVCFCGHQMMVTRPSGARVCQSCGRPWEVLSVRPPRP